MTQVITIEALEQLAQQIEADAATERARLERLIRAYARIVAGREPEIFKRRATEFGDEAGHYDNSYPPKLEFRVRTGERLIRVSLHETTDVPTSSGFYYDWRRETENPGLYVATDGRIWGCEETGTGRVGQFAAHPGDCSVDVTLEWSPRDRDELTPDDLRECEEHMRKLAFPVSQAA